METIVNSNNSTRNWKPPQIQIFMRIQACSAITTRLWDSTILSNTQNRYINSLNSRPPRKGVNYIIDLNIPLNIETIIRASLLTM